MERGRLNMANWFNNFLVKAVPLMPKIFIGLVAKKYVAGKSIDDAVSTVRKLNNEGITATIDLLGEHINDLSEAETPLQMYLDLIEAIEKENIDSNVSLKLSQFGLELDHDATWKNFEKILSKIREKDNFIRIDMEDSSVTDITLDIFKRAKSLYPKVGIVLQAYLFRSMDDLKALLPLGINIRICKGIYKESSEIVYQDPQEIRENFFNLVKFILDNNGYAAIATHDLYLINQCKKYINDNKIPSDRYEFQALYGVPIKKTLSRLVNDGHKVRVYVPFGEDWYAYSIRRLKENPDIAGYIFKDFFKINFLTLAPRNKTK